MAGTHSLAHSLAVSLELDHTTGHSHTYCVCADNFVGLLWHQVFDFQARFVLRDHVMEAGWGLSRPIVISFPPNQTDLYFPLSTAMSPAVDWSTHSNHLNEFTNGSESLSHIFIQCNSRSC